MGTTSIHQLKRYFGQLERFPRRKRGLCIGDSWFQYPLRSYPDLQALLASPGLFGSKVNFVDDSHPGRDADEVFGMIRGWNRLARTMREDFKPFDLILLSLGGNDAIGLDFARHLKRADAPEAPHPFRWNPARPDVVRRHLRLDALAATFGKIAEAYRVIVEMRDAHAPDATIVTHTYADVTPMDVGYQFLTFRSGPWIFGPARAAGLTDPAEQKALVRWLLVAFHRLLREVQADTSRFVVLDTRLELPDPRAWDNEIHPRGPGFRHLAETVWAPAIRQALA